jgi:hypothetical protein
VRALGKKKVETAKAVVPQGKVATPQGNTATWQGKGVLKRPSNMEVTPERPIKQIKKVMSRLAATTTTTGVAARASGSKVVVGKKKRLWCLLRSVVFLLLVLWRWRLRPIHRSLCLTARRIRARC